jgi:site-specific DNA-methyltransferase (adenine-specific)
MKHIFEIGDCFEKMKLIPDNSIDMCLTDPPYFIDGLGDDWDTDKIQKRLPTNNGSIKSLPKGMKFDKKQGPRFQEFMAKVSTEVFRVLKPGGFFVSFSQARLYHRMTIAVEDAGFEIRDMLGWHYSGQAKAFSQDHIIKKQKNLTDQQKEDLIKELDGWKTPQLRPCIEPMCLAQKPTEGTFINNWQKYGVGLVNVKNQWEDQFPGNIIHCPKPSKKEKGDFNDHVSVKPVKLCEHLIKLFSQEGAIILDPFLGSGTTMIAAEKCGRDSLGYELSPKYFDIIQQRYDKITMNGLLDIE